MKPPWFSIAEREIGVKEIPGPGAEPRITAYHAATTLGATSDEIPWCSAFVSWCLEQAGVASTRSARARSYLTWGLAISHPPIGAVCVLSRGGNPTQGHVGFLAEREGDRVFLLGGNQGDAVSIAPFPTSQVLSYRWPN